MHVKLVAVTQPTIPELTTPEDLIVYCARVSNPSNQLNTATGDRLLKYCIEHKHWSVFEQVDMTVEIQTSRAISAQIIRHKTASFQEASGRYMSVKNLEDIELRQQGKTNRQVGDEVFDPEIEFNGSTDKASVFIEQKMNEIQELYDTLLSVNVARESARMILPMTSQTTLYMKNNVRNWIHYIELRTKEDSQKEHRLIAEGVKKLFIQQFPIVSKALGWI